MPVSEVPSDESAILLQGCAGSTFSVEVLTTGAELRIGTSPDVSDGEVLRDGRTATVQVPEDAERVYAKAYETTSPAEVYVNRREGSGLTVERESPTVIDRIRDGIEVSASSQSLYPKFQTFEFTGNYSKQVDPSWNYIGEIGITILSGEMGIEIEAGDGDSDQMAIDSPMVFDKTEANWVKFHDTQNSNPRVVGWISGVDS